MENEVAAAVTVHGERYRATFGDFEYSNFEEYAMDEVWFQQPSRSKLNFKFYMAHPIAIVVLNILNLRRIFTKIIPQIS